MARRIEKIGNGNALINGAITNLRQFKTIKKDRFGLGEDLEGSTYSIALTPLNPTQEDIENGVDGTYHIAYKEDEKEDYEADYQALLQSM